MKLWIGVSMTLVLAAACSDDSVPVTQTGGPANAAATTSPAATVPADRVLAVGLTARQLEDADIVDASGRELGDVERLVTGPGGELTSLIVEVEDSDPDQFVTLPLNGLAVVQNGNDRDLRTNMTWEQLRALPGANL